ncbi:MAG: DUF1800 domain-containing protein [Cocleimonas sp.]|nr:DUF1800 domain-containing protein [Cocleimonas sp.]
MGTINLQDSRHLLMRTGLGVRWNDLQGYQHLSRKKSVQHIVYRSSNRWVLPLPRLARWIPWTKNQSIQQRRTLNKRLAKDKQVLREWVVLNMLRSPYPLTERMILFWHNHFTSSLNKVNQPNLLLKQTLLFRRHGLDNFKQLLHEVSRDPALLIYLDNQHSQRDKPNENFARELLELYTVGEGQFSEADVRGAAQAFTGWGVDRRKKRFVFHKEQHDNRIKYFMGQKGRFTGKDIIDILLTKPQLSEHIATKFWYEFISDEKPNQQTIRRWGNLFRHARYDIRTLLVAVLDSPEFWSEQHRGEKIKSPIELVIGTLRSLILKPPSTARIVGLCDKLGQKILIPDTPEGCMGGQAWIDTYTLPTRINLMSTMIHKATHHDLARIPTLSLKDKANWLLARKNVNRWSQQSMSPRWKLHILLTDPAYQLT